MVKEAPTVLRSSVRLILTIFVTFGFKLRSRHVKQAFIQSEFPLDGPLYIKPPLKLDLMRMRNQPSGMYLHALKPIYELTESPGYWWQTFKPYNIDDLGMTQSTLGPCLFFKKEEQKCVGIIATLVDDTLGGDNLNFSKLEEHKSKKFDVKPRDELFPMRFGGITIMLHL